MLKKILLALVVTIALFAAYAGATKPDDFAVSRSIVIEAPAAAIFPRVNVQKNWETWSPWAKIDPEAQFSYSGPLEGLGSVAQWDGNMEVGTGTSTIVESRDNEYIRFQLDFEKPLKNTNTAEFTFREEGDSTTVTWSMTGKNNLLGKMMSVLFNCEKIVGEKFDEGLSNLKNSVEQQ